MSNEQPQNSSPSSTSLKVSSTWENYEKIRALSSGGAGQVFIVKEKMKKNNDNNNNNTSTTNTYFVMKRIFIDNQETLVQAQTEISTMQQIPDHLNCIRIVDAFRDTEEEYINIIQEYSCIGDLDRLMQSKRNNGRLFDVKEIIFLAAQVLVGLRHLHAHNILHRDLKPQNLVLDFFWKQQSGGETDDKQQKSSSSFSTVKQKLRDQHCYLWYLMNQTEERRKYLLELKQNDGSSLDANSSHQNEEEESHIINTSNTDYNCSSDGDSVTPCSNCLSVVPISECCIKIADFGVARTLGNTTSSAMATTVLGTPFYLAAELIENSPYTYPVDLWSWGVVLWEMGCRTGEERLFKGDNMLAVVMAITTCQIRPLEPPFDVLMPMIEDVVRVDPRQRLTADEMLKKFFS